MIEICRDLRTRFETKSHISLRKTVRLPYLIALFGNSISYQATETGSEMDWDSSKKGMK